MYAYPRKQNAPSGKGRFLIGDMEAVGLLNALRSGDPSSMHVIHVHDLKENKTFTFFDPYEHRDPEAREHLSAEGRQDGYLTDGLQFILDASGFGFHNYSGYDGLAFEKVAPEIWQLDNLERRGESEPWSNVFPFRVMDTYVLSTLLNPDRKVPHAAYALGKGNVGPHSIEAHGIKIGRYKPDNEDWSKLTDHMLVRVREDVAIGTDLFWSLMHGEWNEHLRRGGNKVTGLDIHDAYRMEMQTALSMGRQAMRGFRLDMAKSLSRYEELQVKIKETEEFFRPHMPPRLKKKTVKQKDIQGWSAKASALYNYMPDEDAAELEDKLTQWLGGSDRPFEEDEYAWKDQPDDITHISYAATMWNPTNKGGAYSKTAQKYIKEARGNINDYPAHKRPIAGPFTPLVFEEIPLGNRDTVKQVLYPLGWLGVNYNDTEQDYLDEHGELPHPWSGKIDEDSLKQWKERCEVPEWAEGIAAWYVLGSRSNQILNAKDMSYHTEHGEWPKQTNGRRQCRGLMARAWSDEYHMEAQDFYDKMGHWPTDGEWRVPAVAISIGTNTFRMRHRNVVNIPSRGLYPLRDLFIAGEGKQVLGCDGSGLELRMLAHFMRDVEYIKVVLEGDIHSFNQEMAGLPTRDMAKTFILNAG